MKKKELTKCKSCGSTKFIIIENAIFSAENKDGELDVYKNISNEIESIICENCSKEYQVSDFKNIFFNW